MSLALILQAMMIEKLIVDGTRSKAAAATRISLIRRE